MEEVVPKMARQRGLDADNPERGELDPADDNSTPGKRTKEGCDRGSEIGTVHSGRDGKESVPLRKPKKSGRRESCQKDFVSR